MQFNAMHSYNQMKQTYTSQLNALQSRQQALAKALKEQEEKGVSNQNVDRIELTKELAQVNEQYQATSGALSAVQNREMMQQSAEAAKQQGEAMGKSMQEMSKCLEIFRRISKGGIVPPADEQKLLNYSKELYMTAKNMALIAEQEHKKYDSLWEDEEEETTETTDADGEEATIESAGSVAEPAVTEAAPVEAAPVEAAVE